LLYQNIVIITLLTNYESLRKKTIMKNPDVDPIIITCKK